MKFIVIEKNISCIVNFADNLTLTSFFELYTEYIGMLCSSISPENFMVNQLYNITTTTCLLIVLLIY